jgi:DNA repair protein RecN (Recombination protein N)
MTDLLSYQVREIEAAHLVLGEEEGLRLERDRLANAEALASLAQQCLMALEDGSPETLSLSDMIGQVTQLLNNLSRIDHSQEKLSDQVSSIAELTADLSRNLRDYLEQIEYNPQRLKQVEERLEMIHTLERKYGGSIETVLAFCEEAEKKLDSISHSEEHIAELEIEEQKIKDLLSTDAWELSRIRHKASEGMNQAIENELAELSMSGAHFSVDFQIAEDPQGLLVEGRQTAFDNSGIDRVEFLIAPNPGEGFKPLVKTASGGETSRLMLALKNVMARADNIPTLIFDEIDQGIGGKVGLVVGEKLWQLARRHQVFCVTHLPQLAAFGDQQLGVRKRVQDGRTQTEVDLLNEETRLDELAVMLGTLSEITRTAASELLEKARQKAIQIAEPPPQ